MNYKNAESLAKPSLVDMTSSPDGIYVRRNIEETETENGTKYTYEECFMSQNEYETYSRELVAQTIKGEDNSQAYVDYKKKLDTPIRYPANGFTYKPKWAETVYAGLIQKGTMLPSLFPLKIWDSTEKEENAVNMTIEELTALAVFLADKQETFFTEYKLSKN